MELGLEKSYQLQALDFASISRVSEYSFLHADVVVRALAPLVRACKAVPKLVLPLAKPHTNIHDNHCAEASAFLVSSIRSSDMEKRVILMIEMIESLCGAYTQSLND